MAAQPGHDLAPQVEAFLHELGLSCEGGAQLRPDQLHPGGWYTLPNGERVMAVADAAGVWRLHRPFVSYYVRPDDGALLRCCNASDPRARVAFTDWTVADLVPDPWVPRP